MLRTNLPRAIRALRRRHRWRQADLAERAGVSRQSVSHIERGKIGPQSLRLITHLLDALGATADLTVRWQGENLDRLFDAVHARVVEHTVALLRAAGWTTRVEVSFNHFGDRGRIDILAMHPLTGVLLVIEVKSGIGDLQDTLGQLDVKVRLAPALAAESGWGRPNATVRVLVIADSRTARRVIARHDATLAAFTRRGRSALSWVRRPAIPAPSGLLWFAALPDATGASITRHSRVRVDRSERR